MFGGPSKPVFFVHRNIFQSTYKRTGAQRFHPVQIYITTHHIVQFPFQDFMGLGLSTMTEACRNVVSRWVGRPIMGLRHKDRKENPKNESPVNKNPTKPKNETGINRKRHSKPVNQTLVRVKTKENSRVKENHKP